MSDNDLNRGARKGRSEEDRGILERARKDWDRAMERERDNVEQAYTDLEFLAGHNYSQWDAKAKQERDRAGRPTLQINTLPQFVHQITGDMRQMKPALKFVPVDDGGDEKKAELIGGLTRYIENRSDAPGVYSRAGDSQVACGVGGWTVLTEYADDSTFNQELRIVPIEDPVSVLWDPDSTMADRSDAKFCFVPVDMNKEAFKEKYPDASPSDFDDVKWGNNVEWVTDEHIRVAAYWCRKPEKRTLVLIHDGRIVDLTDDKQKDEKIAAMQQMAAQLGVPLRVEERDSYCLYRHLLTSGEVLESVKWPGRLIPVVTVVGEEIRIGRKIVRMGIVRAARDAQRMVNYFHSAHTEVVAAQPKAPFMVTEENIAQYQGMWETANSNNWPYLIYKPDSTNSGAAPQRVQPPVSSQGVLDGLTIATQSQKAVIGIYDPSLGAKSNETSGKAIEARQREGDVGSYLYIDNMARGIRRTGQILVDLIPHIYDAERTIRIMGEDGKIDIVQINQAQGIGDDAQILNDVTVGSYDVVAQVGPSYTTKREQALQGMTDFLRSLPDTAPLVADKMVKAMDFPLADDIAKRLRATLPPNIIMREEMEEQGASEEQIRQQLANMPHPPSPEEIKAQNDKELAAAKIQADSISADQKLRFEAEKHQMEMQFEREKFAQEMAFEREKHQMEMAFRNQEMQMKGAELHLKAAEGEQNIQIAREKNAVDADIKREQIKQKGEDKPAAAIEVKHGAEQLTGPLAQVLKEVAKTFGEQSQKQHEALAATLAEMGKPKRVRKNKDGSWQTEAMLQ